MLIFVISTVILIIFSFFFIKAIRWYKRTKWGDKDYYDSDRAYSTWFTITLLYSVIHILYVAISVIVIVCKPIRYIETYEEKQSLEQRLYVYHNSDKPIEMKDIEWQVLYKEVRNYNIKVKTHRYRYNNLFIGWFYSKKIGELDTIDYSFGST